MAHPSLVGAERALRHLIRAPNSREEREDAVRVAHRDRFGVLLRLFLFFFGFFFGAFFLSIRRSWGARSSLWATTEVPPRGSSELPSCAGAAKLMP